MEESDLADLVLGARRGERTAQELLVRRYLRPAYVVALGVVGSAADAEDVAQESLMVALKHLDQCREPARFAAWLLRSVRNRALKQLAQRSNRARLLRAVERGEARRTGARAARAVMWCFKHAHCKNNALL